MGTSKEKKFIQSIIITVFWCIVAVGLLSSKSVTGFWRFACLFWLVSLFMSLFSHFMKYSKEQRRAEEERYRKHKEEQDRFNRIFNDYAKKIYEQQQRHRQTLTVKPEMSITDAYKLMKLTYSNTPEDVKKRYRQLAMQWHPDKFATESKSKQEAANRNFQKLNSAYNVIKKHKNIA